MWSSSQTVLSAWLWLLGRAARRDQRGQTTAEYALVIVGAVAVGALVLAWAGKTHAITRLFDATIGVVIDQVQGG